MYRLPKTGLLLCTAIMSLLLPFEAAADFARTPQEEAMCQAMVYRGHDTSDRRNWMHMHHYCDCIRFTNRAYSLRGNKNLMRGSLGAAIGGCDYVLRNTTPDFHMRPEVHLQKGKALKLLGQEAKAINEFMEAIKGNPKLVQAYVEFADIQARNRKFGESLKTVIEGLRQNPGTKSLQRRYTELGGKLPYPAPIEPPSIEATKATNPDETAAPILVESSAGTSATVTPATDPVATPKIGSPKNPYCRFCPD